SETTSSGDGQTETGTIDDWAHYLIARTEDASALTFADVDGADDARSFLDATDFSSQTIYVERHLVDECFRHRLCWVRWTESEVETDYARLLRDADFACEANAQMAVTYLIRLPVTLEPGQINSYGSGSGGGPCPRPDNTTREGNTS
ncbi:MAG: hypothetical protein ABEI27_02655, partial [Halobellus sp.]